MQITKRTRRFSLFLIISCISIYLFAPVSVSAEIEAETAKWKWDATAAYTITHDDLCDYSTQGLARYADTIAYNRDIVWGGGAILKSCEDESFYDKLQTIASHGHEIVSHSWNHTDIDGGWNMETEIVNSKETLEEKIPGIEVTFFVFPMDKYNNEALDYMEENGYLGARAGPAPYDDRGVITNFNNFDPFHDILFDAYHETQNDISIYNSCPQCLEDHVEAAISGNGWAIRELHGIEDESWGVCGLNNYRDHLDYVKSKVDDGDIWVGTPSQVIKYIMTYINCGDADVTDDVLSSSSPDDVPEGYDTEITVILVFDSDPGQIEAIQGGENLEVEKISSTEFFVQVNPTKGDVDLELGTETVFKSLSSLVQNNIHFNKGNIIARLPEGAYKIQMFSINGQKVSIAVSGYSKGEIINASLNIDGLGNGYYILDVLYNGGRISNKVLLYK